MKKMLMVSMGLCALLFVSENGYAQNSEEVVAIEKRAGDSGIQNYDENQIRFFELEKELNSLKEKEFNFTGFIGTKVEVEQLSGDADAGKVKFILAEGNIKHKSYDNWSMYYNVAKEQIFSSKMWDRSNSPQNTIVEIVPRYQKSFNNDKGVGALEFIYTSESIDNRDAVKLKPSVYYKLDEKLALNNSFLIGREFKGGYDDYELIELEPGFGYKLRDDFGMGINYFFKWGQTSNERFTERERFFKPYMWKSFADLGLELSLWGEIGPYSNNHGARHNNTKFGITGNKRLTEALKAVGEISYKREEQKSSEKNIDVTFVMLGLQYSF